MTEFSFEETPESRSQSSGNSEDHELTFVASGEFDDYNVHSYAYSLSPVTVARPTGILYRTGVNVSPNGHKQYLVRVSYGRKKSAVGEMSFSFDTTGATVHINAGISHVMSYTADGEDTSNPYKGAINVKSTDKGKEAEGTDIIIPALKLTLGYRNAQGVVTMGYAKSLARATGRTNSNPFLDYAAGELLFVGASGSDGTESEAEVSYQFIASENVTDATVGEITNIVKGGHHNAWVEFEDEVSGGKAVTLPKRVHVDIVYGSIDFASVFGWS